MKNIRVLVYMALLIAMDIILTRFLSFQTPIVRVSFGFLPIAFSAILFGPVLGGVTAALSDIIGMMLFPPSTGPYFPGFTLSAFIGGAIYGLFLHKNPKSVLRTVLAVVTIILFVDLGLNTLWLTILTGKAASAIIIPRITKSLIMLPVQVALITLLWRSVGSMIGRGFSTSRK